MGWDGGSSAFGGALVWEYVCGEVLRGVKDLGWVCVYVWPAGMGCMGDGGNIEGGYGRLVGRLGRVD